jgi:hypothetical protein
MEEHLRFLINQTEERIKLVDTKASIIIAFFALMLGSHEYLQSVVTLYEIPIFYCYVFIGLLFCSFLFLILTIRPVRKWKILWDFKCNKKSKVKTDRNFWIENERQAVAFDINKIVDIESSYQILFRELTKRRILKYKNYRRSMWFLRIAFISLIPILVIIIIRTYC